MIGVSFYQVLITNKWPTSVTHIESLRRAADKWLWNIRALETVARDVAGYGHTGICFYHTC